MKLPSDQTIAALATPPGAGALAVIRLSGADAFNIAESCFVHKGKSPALKPFRVHYGYIKTGGEEYIDDVLVTAFKAPKSYTGEDTVEISCHGNPLIVSAILNTLLLNGARDAEPGEFTKRAYLNGRLDLSQAEAVAEIINARSQSALRGGRNQLDGLLSAKVHDLRSKLVNASSLVELELDFAEEDVEFIDNSGLTRLIQEIMDDISALLATYSFGRVMREGVNVALVGMPNVGKSSLLNYLLKESRAIVSEIAGTTRDVLREEMIIDGFLFRLYDTAGIRATEDVIEIEGVARSRETVRNADLVLFMNDINNGVNQELYKELLTLTTADKIITVLNKADIYKGGPSEAGLALSAKTGEGMDTLLKTLREKASGGSVYTEKTVIITTQRHFNALTRAKEQLEFALGSVRSRMSGEFISVDLRNASDSLGEIIGEVTEDDILNNIFSKFCIGK